MRALTFALIAAVAVTGCAGSDSDSDSAGGDSAILDVGVTTEDSSDGGTGVSSGTADGDFASDTGSSESADSTDVVDDSAASSPSPVVEVSPQSGILTAGDYDDQLNPERYQAYARNALQNFPSSSQAPVLNLDVDDRVQLRIVDDNGNPQARASLQVRTIGDGQLNLRTAADGTVWLYPSMDALPAVLTVSVADASGDTQLQQFVDTTQLDDERSALITLPGAAASVSALDIALVIDTTGSMGDELAYLQAELTDILNTLTNANPTVSIRVALIPYRDEGDAYVVRTYPFTSSISEAQNALNGESFAGGGDYPEAMDQALQAMLALDWRSDAIGVTLLVADAPPHANRMQATWQSALAARNAMIQMVPVAASGSADEAEYIMRAMAAVTQGRYLFLTDDSGVGNTHAEPTIDCYLVTRLDGLLVRVVQSLLSGERVEPAADQVVRQVGIYNNGVCSDQ